ncbi:MAG: Trehalose utilization [Planctomycetaceae bacterium]|nr:Trehalose utilization [Planctomycetaceae bacterium]
MANSVKGNTVILRQSQRTASWRAGILLAALSFLAGMGDNARADDSWIVFEGKGDGAGKGKHIVLISGDDEYRSEESLPQLAKILSTHHGFKCTVLFPIDPKDGTIKPDLQTNIPGLEALNTADLAVIFLRFRNLPDDQMQLFVDFAESGKPMIGMRTATHSFNIPGNGKFAKYGWTFGGKDYEQGFGRQVLGETWISHHGNHGKEGTRGIIAPGQEKNPILRGIKSGDIFGLTDVYGVRLPLPGDSQPLVLGEVTETLESTSKPVVGAKNSPMMPVAWTKTYKGASGKVSRVFNTTMGASQDLQSEGVRRMLVNAVYWGLGLEDKIDAKSSVDIVGTFTPTRFSFGGYVKGKKPADYAK